MPSTRKMREKTEALRKGIRNRRTHGRIYKLYNNMADVRVGNSPTLLKNVLIQGNSDELYIGKEVALEWADRDGNPDKAPVITGGGTTSAMATASSVSSTVSVDDITITKGYEGLKVKPGGIGTQHLNFKPAFDDHEHKSKFEEAGWGFTDDGILFAEKMYLHPQGMMKIGGGYQSEDNVIVLDSQDAIFRLWAGNQSPTSAPFSVSKTGSIVATSGNIAAWAIDNQKISGGGIEMYSAGYIQSNPFTSGLIGFRIDDDVAEFNNVRVRGELRTTVFTYDEIHANAGTLGVFLSAGVLLNDAVVPADADPFSVDIKDPETGHAQLFTAGDVLRIKDSSGGDTWMTVSSVSDQTTFYRYTCNKTNGTGSITYRAGAAVVDYGASGDGFITLSADGGVGSSPNITLATHSGTPWSTSTLLGRIGNLNGSYGQVTDVYGFGFGDYDNDKYIRWVNSLGVLQIAGAIQIGQGFGFTTSAVIHLPFDGPAPYKTNFSVSLLSHVGHSPYDSDGALIGWRGKWHKALQVGKAKSNWIYNPRFETAVTPWILQQGGSGGTITRITTDSFIGVASLRVLAGSSWTQARSGVPNSVPNNTRVSIQCRAKIGTGGGTGDAKLILWDNTSSVSRGTASVTQVGEWQYLTVTWVNTTGGAKDVYVILRNDANDGSTSVYFDAVQMEDGYITPYFDGDFEGAVWGGTAHNSPSDRSNPKLSYDNVDFPAYEGSLSTWVKISHDIDTADTDQYIAYYGSGFRLSLTFSSDYLHVLWAGTNLNYSISTSNFSKDIYHHVAVTWSKSNNQLRLYLDGVLVSSGGYTSWSQDPTLLYIGSNTVGTDAFNGWIDDLAIIARPLTATEVYQIYTSDVPLNVSGRQLGFYITQEGLGKVIGDAGGIRTYDPDSNWKSTLSSGGLLMQSNGTGYIYDNRISIISPGGFEMLEISSYWPTAIAAYTTFAAKDPDGRENNLFITSEGNLQIETYKSGAQIKLQTTSGYISLGPANTSWCHFQTDRANFYFYKGANMVGTGLAVTSATTTPPSAGIIQSSSHMYAGGGMRIGATSGATSGYLGLSNTINLSQSAGCRITYTTGAQSIASGAWNVVTFNSAWQDTYGWRNVSSIQPDLGAGIYLVGGTIEWASNSTGNRGIAIRLNGSSYISVDMRPAASITQAISITAAVYLNGTGDYVQLMAYQSSGSPLSINRAVYYSPEFWMVRIA